MIKDIKQHVKDAIDPIEKFQDIFDRNKDREKEWESTFNAFKSQVEHIEDETIQLIDSTFTNLKSSESAFDLI